MSGRSDKILTHLMETFEVGQEVVLMSAPGRFRITSVDGNVLTLTDVNGASKRVLDQAVRVLPPIE